MTERSTPRALRREDVGTLAVGASLLGSGGGGDPSTFAAILGRKIGSQEIPLLGPGDLAGAIVVPVGMAGGTSVLAEKLPGGSELRDAVAAVCRWSGLPPEAVMATEAGGMNALTGLVAALDLEVPYLDADLMGRALPRLDQFTWATAGLPMMPAALCQANGQVVMIDGGTPDELERTARTFVAELGGWATIALRPTEVSAAAAASVLGGASRALELGRAHAGLPATPSRSRVEEALGARPIGAGRVLDVDRQTHPSGFGRGGITIVDDATGALLRVESENEFLLAMADGEVVATCPDILCLLQARTAQPIPVDRVHAGDDVMLIVLPGPEWWMTPQRIGAVSPRAFDLDAEPVIGGGRS